MKASVGLALAGVLLAAMGGAILEGYFASATVGGLSAADFGVFAFLAFIAAVVFYAHEGSSRIQRFP